MVYTHYWATVSQVIIVENAGCQRSPAARCQLSHAWLHEWRDCVCDSGAVVTASNSPATVTGAPRATASGGGRRSCLSSCHRRGKRKVNFVLSVMTRGHALAFYGSGKNTAFRIITLSGICFISLFQKIFKSTCDDFMIDTIFLLHFSFSEDYIHRQRVLHPWRHPDVWQV